MTIVYRPSASKRYLTQIIHEHGFYSDEVKAFRREIQEAILLLLKNFHSPMDLSLFHTLMQSQYYEAYHYRDIQSTVMQMVKNGQVIWQLDRRIALPEERLK